MMNTTQAITEIKSIFGAFGAAFSTDNAILGALSDGKLYEAYVISKIVDELASRNYQITFRGTSLLFKGGPGMIKLTDPHFELFDMATGAIEWRIFADIEFDTIGHVNKSGHPTYTADLSRRHELDIVVTNATAGYPKWSEIALGAECKSTPNFKKALMKEALGVRREFAFFRQGASRAILNLPRSVTHSAPVRVRAHPPSEFIVASIDPDSLRYSASPAAFGIKVEHWEP